MTPWRVQVSQMLPLPFYMELAYQGSPEQKPCLTGIRSPKAACVPAPFASSGWGRRAINGFFVFSGTFLAEFISGWDFTGREGDGGFCDGW